MVLEGDNLVREHNAKIESIYSVFLAVIVSFNEVMTRVKHAITAEKKKTTKSMNSNLKTQAYIKGKSPLFIL